MVTHKNYLDFRNHWEAVIQLIADSARQNECGHPDIRPEKFQCICVEEMNSTIGDVLGAGELKLYLCNEGLRHYVPLIELRWR